MCTVSWIHRDEGYLLLFNRDELLSRKPASSPRIDNRNGIAFIAPMDGDHGGSWIAVNQFGLSLGLLNRFDESKPDVVLNYTSRGLLLFELIDCASLTTISRRLNSASLDRFRPFSLLALGPNEPAMLFHWTGSQKCLQQDADNLIPIASSSLNEEDVVQKRKQLFEEMTSERGKVDPDLLIQFHESHRKERGPTSVCMHRADARTVSMSVINVTKEKIEFDYHPDSPCMPAKKNSIELKRTSPNRGPR